MDVITQDRMTSNAPFWNFKGQVDYVDEWFLMSNPVPLSLIVMIYLLFVLKLGPEYMKNKPAFQMGKVLAVYNVAQVVLSAYMSYVGTNIILVIGLINSSCVMDNEAAKYAITSGTHFYMLAKLSELLDTMFFVLKKNFRQITFLHIYHHTVMMTFSWLFLKYEPSHSVVFLGTLNSYVHVVMYTYYCLSGFPELARYLWWKKYITKMQITQFILVIIQAVVSYYNSTCPPSYILFAVIIGNAMILTVLFTKFYIDSYKKKKIN